MLAIFKYFLCVITTHVVETVAAVLAFVGAALLAFTREQVRAGVNWALAPLARLLPWNGKQVSFGASLEHEDLICDLSLVDVFLCDSDGRSARYQKTSSYVATNELNWYQEGVTAEGHANAFFTMRGTIVETVKEHGFYISRIDLGDVVQKGLRFTNVYGAELHDCFLKSQEHWTQELAFPTKHLTIQVHFPQDRPPKLVRCKTVEGTREKPANSAAKLVELFGKKSIVWEVEQPKARGIFKVEWSW